MSKQKETKTDKCMHCGRTITPDLHMFACANGSHFAHKARNGNLINYEYRMINYSPNYYRRGGFSLFWPLAILATGLILAAA